MEIDEKELQNGNLEDFGTACLPDLKNSHYWSIRKFYRNNFYEFVRTGALSPQHKMRWLSFKLKEEMKKGKTYRITFCIKYSEDVEVQVFLHGPGQIEKFPKQELYAEQWTKFSTQYTVAYEDLQYFGMTASSFITAGNALAVSYIEVIEVEE
ncbi:hypothetical protein IW492_15810 [Enterococcus sp. BWB1-3]|nr:hypothetical protein [Enterococcus sp. BWB1-3]